MSYIVAILTISYLFKHLPILQAILGSIFIIGLIFIQIKFESDMPKILNALIPCIIVLAVLLFVAFSNGHSVEEVIEVFKTLDDLLKYFSTLTPETP